MLCSTWHEIWVIWSLCLNDRSILPLLHQSCLSPACRCVPAGFCVTHSHPCPSPCPGRSGAPSLEQVCMGKTALLRPESSFRYICRVSGFISLSVLSYQIGSPPPLPAGSPCWQVDGKPPSVSICSFQKRSMPSTLGLWHHDLFKAWTDGVALWRKARAGGQLAVFLGVCFSGRTYKSPKHIHIYGQLLSCSELVYSQWLQWCCRAWTSIQSPPSYLHGASLVPPHTARPLDSFSHHAPKVSLSSLWCLENLTPMQEGLEMEARLTSPPGPSSLIIHPAHKPTQAQGCKAEGIGFSCLPAVKCQHGTTTREYEERSELNLQVVHSAAPLKKMLC